jgi:hypothetical protein
VPKKKSAKRTARRFSDTTLDLDRFCDDIVGSKLDDQWKTWAVEAALIKLAVGFERLMLDALVAAVNNDTAQISNTTGVQFPKHLTDEVCEYIVTGGGYFDFRGRSGLISLLKRYLPTDHYLVVTVKWPRYKRALENLIALRNFAAHESAQSKRRAKDALGVSNLSSAGAWLKRQDRFRHLSKDLRDLSNEIEQAAPY